jgi:4-amino-4-deoxy-L-arabinose transferase-like glycosyltransferase
MKLAELLSPRRLGAGRTLLVLGIVLRIVVFFFLDPINNDRGHAAMVTYIAEHHAIPSATANAESYQPPLYYLLAAPLYAATGSLKFAQLASLACSILTLLVFYRLLYFEKLLPNETATRYSFVLACFLPQFVMFGLYVSNDTLAILIGALLVWQTVRFIAKPGARETALIVLGTSLALLTKATFLSFLPVLFALIAFVLARRSFSAPKVCAAALAVTIVAAGLGSWRFVQSYREVGDPFASNLNPQFKWVAAQQRSYRGAATFLDIDLLKLVASPSVTPLTEGSYPLLLYGTFWFQHIPESNFEVSSYVPYDYLGSVIFVLALVPSVVFFFGLFLLAQCLPRFLARSDLSQPDDQRTLVALVAVAFLFGNIALLIAVALKSHVWSVMQGRLLFPSFAGLLLPFGIGVSALATNRRASAIVAAAMIALAVCFYLFYASEISSQLGGWPFV